MSQKWKEFTTIPKILACQMDHIILSNPIWKGIGSFFDQNPSNHKYAVKKEGFKDFIETLYGQIKPIPYLCRLKTFATI